MPSERVTDALRAILENIALARQFCATMTIETFTANIQVRYATIRCLEIISEASRRLPEDMKERHRDVKWAAIAGAGNVYRHDYEQLEAVQLWKTVHEALDTLQVAARDELGPEGQ